MRLNILENENTFIASTSRADSPFTLPPMYFGDAVPIELYLYRRSPNDRNYFTSVDLSTYDISLELGSSNQTPSLGFWTVTTAQGTSSPIASRATASEVQQVLSNVFRYPTVEGGAGSYVMTLKENGVQPLPTAAFQGNTLSAVLVFEITPGTATTPAQYRFEVLEVAPARVPPIDWADGDTTLNNTVVGSGKLWTLSIDEKAVFGFFYLTVNGTQTALLEVNAGILDIVLGLTALGHPCKIQRSPSGELLIAFNSDISTLTIGAENLKADPYQVGRIGLSSTGVRELLDGVKWTTVELSVKISKSADVITVASMPLHLKMPTNQPAVINIDTPSNSGLTISISPDGAYLEIIQDGQIINTVPLLPP